MNLFKKMSYKRVNLERLTAEISKLLSKEHARYKEVTVIPQAKDYAHRHLPALEETSIELYVQPFRGFYTGLKQKICLLLEVGVQKVLGMIGVKAIEQKIKGVKDEISLIADTIKQLLIDRDRVPAHYCRKKDVMRQIYLLRLIP